MKKSTLIILTILGVGMIAAGVLVSHLFDESYTTSGDYAVLGDYPAAEITEVRVRLQGLSLSVYEHNDRKQLEAAGYGRAVNDVEIRLEDGVLFLTENGGFSSLPTNRDESVTLWMGTLMVERVLKPLPSENVSILRLPFAERPVRPPTLTVSLSLKKDFEILPVSRLKPLVHPCSV